MLHAILLAGGCAAPAPGLAQDAPTVESEVVRFVAVGDIGRDTPERAALSASVARVCAERGCDLGLLLGDNLYDRGMVGPGDPRLGHALAGLQAANVPWYMVHGNHDYAHGRDVQRAEWARDWAARTEGFEHPAPWYRMSAGPADFFALDTTWTFWRGDRAQTAWLREGLDGSGARWKVVFGHHPYRSDGPHGNAGAYEGWVNLPFASGNALRDLFERGLCPAADLYLAGHDHNLQLLERCDVTLVVSGSGSTARAIVPRGNRPSFSRSRTGFAWVELGRSGRVAFYGEDGSLLHESGAITPRSMLY